MSDDPQKEARGKNGRAPDVFSIGRWMPMREYPESEPVDFAIVGTGAGGGTLACRLAEAGFSVIGFDVGPWWRPLEDFASDEAHQSKLFWADERLCDGDDPLVLGVNNSGRSVGGSTVHFAMVSLRFRPEWFKSRTILGYGADWPLDWREMWRYYGEVEQALKIVGPVRYPWGPKRPRYPYRPHELNAAALVLAKGAQAMGIDWAPTPLATISAPRGKSPPCVYRGFCVSGCATNAKQSALITWIPRAVKAGAEIRDLAMVGRIETDPHSGLVTAVHYHRDGRWRFQKARNVVVAGYAIETPRLLLNSADGRHAQGLANTSGLVGRNLMAQSNQAVYGTMDEEVRWYKGPPSLSMTEHWNYVDHGKDFFGGYCYMSQGHLPVSWSTVVSGARKLWGEPRRREMERYNHQAGLNIVGEVLPNERNRVTLADEKDRFGLSIARVTFGYGENDKRLISRAMRFMRQALEAAGASDVWDENDDTCHLNGTARMCAHERRQRRLPELGHPQSLDLRRFGLSHRRRRQSVADDPGDRLPYRRPHPGLGRARRALTPRPRYNSGIRPEPRTKTMAALPRVVLLTTGGTIDSVGKDRLDLAWYIEAGKRLEETELLGQIPELKGIAEIEEMPFRRLASHALVDHDWLDLARAVHAIFDADKADGIVITHGTNTIEETAYFLNLTVKTDKPVVVVGSMRPASAISADGYLNLVNAIKVAADPGSRGMGCLLVMNDTIFNARDVTKNATYRVEAFQSRDLGPLGFADADGKIVYYHRPTRRHTLDTEFDVRHLASLPRVDMVISYVGADGAMIEAAANAGAKAIVSAATGAGRPTPAEDAAFDKVYEERGMLMCLCSRVAAGRVVRSPGLARRGFVAGDNLQPWKARILLSLALTKTRDAIDIQRMFDTY